MAKILRINTEPVKSLAGEKITYLGWAAGAGGPMMNQQGVLVQVSLEYRDGGRVQAASGIIRVITQMVRFSADFLVCHDIAAHQAGQPGQHKLGRSGWLVEVG
jgi:hypothetical protein